MFSASSSLVYRERDGYVMWFISRNTCTGSFYHPRPENRPWYLTSVDARWQQDTSSPTKSVYRKNLFRMAMPSVPETPNTPRSSGFRRANVHPPLACWLCLYHLCFGSIAAFMTINHHKSREYFKTRLGRIVDRYLRLLFPKRHCAFSFLPSKLTPSIIT